MISIEEKPEAFEKLFETERVHWQAQQGKEIASETLKQEAFKIRSEKSKAIIRTGTLKLNTSLILVSRYCPIIWTNNSKE